MHVIMPSGAVVTTSRGFPLVRAAPFVCIVRQAQSNTVFLDTVKCVRGQWKLGNRGRAPQMAPTAFSFCLFLGIKNVAW